MSQVLKHRLILGSHYSHDPRHFRFARQMDSFSPIEDCGERGDRIVGLVSVVIVLMLIFI